MVIDRRFVRIFAAWVGVLAVLIAGIFNIARCHAAAPHIADVPAPYRAATDSNDPQPLSDQGSIVAWGAQRFDRSVFDAQFIAIAAGYSHSLALRRPEPPTTP